MYVNTTVGFTLHKRSAPYVNTFVHISQISLFIPRRWPRHFSATSLPASFALDFGFSCVAFFLVFWCFCIFVFCVGNVIKFC